MPSRKALAHAVLAIAAQLIADEGWHRALGDTALSVVITGRALLADAEWCGELGCRALGMTR
jgi:hypothetical protein